MRTLSIFLSAVLIFSLFTANTSMSRVPDEEKIIIIFDSSPSELDNYLSRNGEYSGIGLVLSGGGSRALAHIGVLKVLDDAGIDIKIIAGVSMGGIIGGLYSAAYSPEEIENIALSISWGRLLSQSPVRSALPQTRKDRTEKSIVKIRFDKWKPVLPKAFTTGQNLWQYLETLSARSGIRPSIDFDYLNPPLRIVATDLSTGEKVVLSSGSLAEAMRATMAVPLAFTPVVIDGRLLVDGGLVDPIPVDVVRDNFAGPVVAVDVSSELLPASKIKNIIDIADQTTTIMSMRKRKEALEQADYVIKPDLPGKLSTDFSDIHSIIEAGENAAREALPKIRSLLENNENREYPHIGYELSGWRITGLSSMPMTFFKTVFIHEENMTTDDILRNLRTAFESGYISDCRAELTPSESGYFLEYHLTDNPRIDNIEFERATIFTSDDFRANIETRPGMILNYKTVLSDRDRFEEMYIRAGYSLARVTTEFDETTGTLKFNIDEGLINRVLVEGNFETRDWAIRRHIPFTAGDIFTQKKADRGVEDLYGTGLFETAKFIAVPDSSGITLKVIVDEKPYKFIRSGARFDLDYGPKAFVDLVDDNLFGAGMELYLSTIVGEKYRSVTFSFKADRIWNTLYTYRLAADYGEFKRNHYIDHKYQRTFREFHHGGELSLGRQFPRLGTILIIGQIKQYRWDEPGKAERQLFEKTSIGFRSIVDTRDALVFPEKGKYHLFDLELAADLSDENSAYTRFFTSIESYYKLSDSFNFHPRLSLGFSSNFMPYFHKFSLGGLESLPGLYKDEIVGEKLLTGSFELRYKAMGPIYLTGRYGFGNIWNRLESIRFSELRNSGAVGISLKTPVGPLSSWYGRTSGGLNAFYLSIGYDW